MDRSELAPLAFLLPLFLALGSSEMLSFAECWRSLSDRYGDKVLYSTRSQRREALGSPVEPEDEAQLGFKCNVNNCISYEQLLHNRLVNP